MASVRTVPRHWNAYRPCYDPTPPTRSHDEAHHVHGGNHPNRNSTRPPHHPTSLHRSAAAVHDAPSRCGSPVLDPSSLLSSSSSSSDPWPAALMSRTARAFDLVMHYTRDSHGGKRWTPASIGRVRRAGKDLHNEIRSLKTWARVPEDERDPLAIDADVQRVVQLCEHVQRVICDTEWALADDKGEEEEEVEEEKEKEEEKRLGKWVENIKHVEARTELKSEQYPNSDYLGGADRGSERHGRSVAQRTSRDQRRREAKGTDSYRPDGKGNAAWSSRHTLTR
ncbi:hypothetical protein ACEQ8H_008837 [Pleosporales sp. CAS-2024a]